MTGLHRKISLHMQVAYHGKCLVDAGFGQVKKLYRRSDVDTLQHLCDVVEQSAPGHNRAVLFQGPDGWEWRDWKSFLDLYFRRIKGIRKYHHFTFDADKPGLWVEMDL